MLRTLRSHVARDDLPRPCSRARSLKTLLASLGNSCSANSLSAPYSPNPWCFLVLGLGQHSISKSPTVILFWVHDGILSHSITLHRKLLLASHTNLWHCRRQPARVHPRLVFVFLRCKDQIQAIRLPEADALFGYTICHLERAEVPVEHVPHDGNILLDIIDPHCVDGDHKLIIFEHHAPCRASSGPRVGNEFCAAVATGRRCPGQSVTSSLSARLHGSGRLQFNQLGGLPLSDRS
jgi:hypothetical protein